MKTKKTKKTSLYVLLLRLDRRGRRGGTRRNTPTMGRTWHERRTKKRQSKYWGKRWRGVGQGAGCTRSICLKFLLLRKGFLEKGKTATRRPWACNAGRWVHERCATPPRAVHGRGRWWWGQEQGPGQVSGLLLPVYNCIFYGFEARVHTFFFSARGGVLN